MVNTDTIWITGMSWSTALGSTIDGVWESLLNDDSGIIEVAAPLPLRSNLAALVRDIPFEWPAWERQRQLTVTTLSNALADAEIAPNDPGLLPVLGTSYGAHLDMGEIPPLSEWSIRAAKDTGCVRGPITVATACSAGSDAILVGLALLKSGAADVCVCGAADVLTFGKRLAHSRLGTLSANELRAFDVNHSGTLLGDGAAFLVLEPAARARARGCRPHGVLAGAGSSNDAASAVAPDSSGRNVILAVERALKNAGLTPKDVAVVNAHGSGTQVNDAVEVQAYRKLFLDQPTPPVVFATKGAFGHTLGATGAIEAVATLQALKTQMAPPVHGLREVVPDFGLPIPSKLPMKINAGAGVSVTLGFGGFNTCLVFQGPGKAAE